MDQSTHQVLTDLPLQQLVARALDELEKLCYSRRSLSRYRSIWRQLVAFSHEMNLGDRYSEELALQFCNTYQMREGECLKPSVTVQSVIKGNYTAGGLLGPHLTSFMDNIKNAVLSGGLDVTRPWKSSVSGYKAFRSLLDYTKDPSGKTGYGGLIIDAKRAGSDYFGFGHEEIGNPASLKFAKDVRVAFKDPNAPFLENVGTLLQRSLNGYQRGMSWLGSGLDWVDRLFRQQSYLSLQDKFLADFTENGHRPDNYLTREGLLLNDPRLQAAANELRLMKWDVATLKELNSPQRRVLEAASMLAARRVNQSFMNAQNVSPALEKWRRSGAGIAAPFATAAFENWRIIGNIPKRIKDEPELKWRLIASMGVAAGAAGITKAMSGVTDEEIRQTDAEVPNNKRTFKNAVYSIAFHDNKGRLQYWDYTGWSEVTRALQGDQSDPWINRVISNLTLAPFQGGMAEQTLRRGQEALGLVTPVGTPQRPVGASETGGMAFMQYLFDHGMFPAAFPKMMDAARRTDIGSDGAPMFLGPEIEKVLPAVGEMIGRPRPYEEILTPMEGSLKAVGITNQEPVTAGRRDAWERENPSRLASDMETAAKGSALRREAKSIFRSNKTEPQKEKKATPVFDKFKQVMDAADEKAGKRKK